MGKEDTLSMVSGTVSGAEDVAVAPEFPLHL